jgi:hypothetical protein
MVKVDGTISIKEESLFFQAGQNQPFFTVREMTLYVFNWKKCLVFCFFVKYYF